MSAERELFTKVFNNRLNRQREAYNQALLQQLQRIEYLVQQREAFLQRIEYLQGEVKDLQTQRLKTRLKMRDCEANLEGQRRDYNELLAKHEELLAHVEQAQIVYDALEGDPD